MFLSSITVLQQPNGPGVPLSVNSPHQDRSILESAGWEGHPLTGAEKTTVTNISSPTPYVPSPIVLYTLVTCTEESELVSTTTSWSTCERDNTQLEGT